MTRNFLIASVVISAGSLTWIFLGNAFWQFALGIALTGVLWLVSIWRHWNWFSNLGLGAIAAGCSLGILNELSPPGMLFSLMFGLAAWDLTALQTRLGLAAEKDNCVKIEQQHLIGFAFYAIGAIIVSILAFNIRLRLGFVQAAILLVAGFAGLMQLVRWFRKKTGS